MASEPITFDVRRGDEWVRVRIEGDFATVRVSGLDDMGILCEALNRAFAAGARRGTLFTGELIPEESAAKSRMRAQRSVTWLGGKVTWLADGPNGPQFRVDFDVWPTITE